MTARLYQSSLLAIAIFLCLVVLSVTQPFSCYHGSIESNSRGQVPLGSESQLTVQPCGHPVTPTSLTTQLPAGSTKSSISTSTHKPIVPSEPTATSVIPTTLAQDSRRRRDISSPFLCAAAKSFTDGPNLLRNTSWTANFSCLADGNCSGNMFCCRNSKCNTLADFMVFSRTKYASVATCLIGSKKGNATKVKVSKCPDNSHFCYNSTTNGSTKFGCGFEKTCSNVTSPEVSSCTKTGERTLCCCASDNCNGLVPGQPTNPNGVVPTTSTPYLVTASRTSSNWTLVLLIGAGFLIGALVGVGVVVLCKRWKRKRMNGPLNISYSRVSADFTVEDDDNIFSY